MSEGTQSWSAAVCGDLQRFLRVRKIPQSALPWGLSASRISERLNLKPPPTLDHIHAALTMLDIDIAEFFEGVRTGFHPELALADFLAESPRQFRRFCRRRVAKPAQREYSRAELHEMAGGLESLRFVDAKAAYHQALEILRSLGPHPEIEGADIAAEAWGVLGVVQRLRGQTSTASGAYLEALSLARSSPVRARTFQRIGMLVFHRDENRFHAWRAIRYARALYVAEGDDSGLGKTLVDEAYIASVSGDCHKARSLYRRSLRYLTDGDVEHRFGAVQGIAVASTRLGETCEAARFLDQASTFPEDRPLMRAALSWLRGELALCFHDSSGALSHLGQALDAAEAANVAPAELVLLQLRVAKAHHLRDDRRALRWTLRDILSLQKCARHSKLFCAVLSEFFSVALQDECARVTVELLDDTYLKLREGTIDTAIVPPLLSTLRV